VLGDGTEDAFPRTPMLTAAPIPVPRTAGRAESDDLHGVTVLVVDDDIRNVFALTSALEMHGMSVLYADNGADAVTLLQERPGVDLVLMDVMMPGMDGNEATERIRQIPAFADLPIVFLTAKAMPGTGSAASRQAPRTTSPSRWTSTGCSPSCGRGWSRRRTRAEVTRSEVTRAATGRAARAATILLVDDRPENLLALEAILHGLGHRLLKATSGEEALKVLLTEEVALMLLDVQMPGMDGFETAAHVKKRERTRDIPILFLTAIGDAHQAFRGYAAGAVDYLAKPFDPWVLKAKVGVFVELYERRAELASQAEELRRQLLRIDPKGLAALAQSAQESLALARPAPPATARRARRWPGGHGRAGAARRGADRGRRRGRPVTSPDRRRETSVTVLPPEGGRPPRPPGGRAALPTPAAVLLDDALLLVTELVTNAVVHAGTAVELHIALGTGTVRIEVVDHSAGSLPVLLGDPERPREGGRGIYLLDVLAQEWGTRHFSGGKSVWFSLAVDERRLSRPRRVPVTTRAADPSGIPPVSWLVGLPVDLEERLSTSQLLDELMHRLCVAMDLPGGWLLSEAASEDDLWTVVAGARPLRPAAGRRSGSGRQARGCTDRVLLEDGGTVVLPLRRRTGVFGALVLEQGAALDEQRVALARLVGDRMGVVLRDDGRTTRSCATAVRSPCSPRPARCSPARWT
jgi:CheY-like chemotaxis protein